MAVQWSGLSPELLLALHREPGAEPLRAQLCGRLREAIRSGRLRPGERLPSSRELARELGTSRGLVQECYGQLQAEGYLAARVGSATTVAARASAPAGPGGSAGVGAVEADVTNEAQGAGTAVGVAARQRLRTDFRAGVPDLASFPRGDWAAVAEQKASSDRGSPVLDQLALAALIESGRFDRHLRRVRGTYARRRQALADALAEYAPGVTLTGLAAGFHAVAHLPAPADEESVVAGARARSVGLYGMSRYRSTGAVRPAQLVLGFGDLSERAIAAGIAAVGDLLQGGC